MTNKNTKDTLIEFGDKIRDQMIENLMNNKSFINGNLAKSIVVEWFERETKVSVEVNEWYGITVEEGIGRKAGKMPPIAPIKNWIKRHPNINPKPGVSLDSFAWAIAKNISKKGTNPKAKPFAAPAVKTVKDNFGDMAIEEAFGKDINDNLMVAFKNSAL